MKFETQQDDEEIENLHRKNRSMDKTTEASDAYRKMRERKIPQYNAKTTIAVTKRVLCRRCYRSEAYLLNCQQGLSLANIFYNSPRKPLSPGQDIERSVAYSQVAHDNLIYGMEMSLKTAQMVDGYHEFNKGLDIPNFIENFKDHAGITYVYVLPTHRLDEIYNLYTSDIMQRALERIFSQLYTSPSFKTGLDECYKMYYPDYLDAEWAPGRNHKEESGKVRYDSIRYTGDWISRSLPLEWVMMFIEFFKRVNQILPSWFNDSSLRIPKS